jgi:RimJ/RimL family protein N-acetyltransferase
MRNPYWPLFELRLRTPRLELRLPDDDDIVAIAGFLGDLHDPAEMPFGVAFTDVPSPQREEEAMRHYWRQRVQWSPQEWHANFAVVFDGAVVGVQGLHTKDFAHRREVSTGSYLRRGAQGQGLGLEMRVAVLTLAFDHLGARWARSGAYLDNPASRRVSEKVGYVEDGTEVMAPRGEPRITTRYLLDRARWEERRPLLPKATVEGLEGCRDWFGV